MNNQLKQYIDPKMPPELARDIALYNYGPPCPLLENNECSIYPVRPLICRGYFVSSDPRSCLPQTNPEALEEEPDGIKSLVKAGGHHGRRIVEMVQVTGLPFEKSIRPLPLWIATEMKWT